MAKKLLKPSDIFVLRFAVGKMTRVRDTLSRSCISHILGSGLPKAVALCLESLHEGYGSMRTLDPRFAVLLTQCLVGDHRSDLRQSYLFEDIFEDFDDGTLCALCLHSDRNLEALPVLARRSILCSRTMPRGSFRRLYSSSHHNVL